MTVAACYGPSSGKPPITSGGPPASRALVGQGVAFLFILVGLLLIFTGAFLSGIWLIFIGRFLNSAASASARQVGVEDALRGVRASQIMTCEYREVSPDISLRELVDTYMLGQGLRALPVVANGELLGLIDAHRRQQGGPRRMAECLCGRYHAPRSNLATVAPTDDLKQVVNSMEARDINQLPVTEGSRLLGLITRSGIIRFLSVRDEIRSSR